MERNQFTYVPRGKVVEALKGVRQRMFGWHFGGGKLRARDEERNKFKKMAEEFKSKRVAKKLGLEFLDKPFPGTQECNFCGTKLQLGRDENDDEAVFCPKCEEIKFAAEVATGLPHKYEPHIN